MKKSDTNKNENENETQNQDNKTLKLLTIVKGRCIETFKDQINKFYVTLKINDHVECIRLQGSRFKNIIRKEYFDAEHFISEEVSDLLCRAVTGAGYSKRALYTNDIDNLYKFKRAIGINGINLATTRADFLDRSLIIDLKRIDKSARKREEEIDKRV